MTRTAYDARCLEHFNVTKSVAFERQGKRTDVVLERNGTAQTVPDYTNIIKTEQIMDLILLTIISQQLLLSDQLHSNSHNHTPNRPPISSRSDYSTEHCPLLRIRRKTSLLQRNAIGLKRAVARGQSHFSL
jgi:hypothetical protein